MNAEDLTHLARLMAMSEQQWREWLAKVVP